MKDKENVKLIAHRGLSGFAPENSLSAIKLSLENFYGIEIDIHSTKDSELVIFHDYTLERMTNKKGLLREYIYNDLKKTKLTNGTNVNEYNNEYIPRLRDGLKLFNKKNIEAIIEIKEVHNYKLLDKVIKEVEKYHLLSKTTIISFNLEYLKYYRNEYPYLKLQYLVNEINDEVIAICKKYKLDVDVNYGSLTKEQVVKCKKQNIKVNVWTVDDIDIAKTLSDFGVDFITTNTIKGLILK